MRVTALGFCLGVIVNQKTFNLEKTTSSVLSALLFIYELYDYGVRQYFVWGFPNQSELRGIWLDFHGIARNLARFQQNCAELHTSIFTTHSDQVNQICHCDLKISIANYFLKTRVNNKCFKVLKCTGKGLQKNISKLER